MTRVTTKTYIDLTLGYPAVRVAAPTTTPQISFTLHFSNETLNLPSHFYYYSAHRDPFNYLLSSSHAFFMTECTNKQNLKRSNTRWARSDNSKNISARDVKLNTRTLEFSTTFALSATANRNGGRWETDISGRKSYQKF